MPTLSVLVRPGGRLFLESCEERTVQYQHERTKGLMATKLAALCLAVILLLPGNAAMSQSPTAAVLSVDTEVDTDDRRSADERYQRGLQRLNDITRGDGQAVLDALSRISPDFARYVIEYPYGDVFSRGTLSDQQRQLATISMLAALGFAQPELKVHINGALNVGVSEDEVVETMILVSVYAGFPASIHGLRAAQEVFDERAAE